MSNTRSWMSRAIACCAARSGAANQASRSDSSPASVGQPNQAFCPVPRSINCPAGVDMSTPELNVKNRLHPPCATGSFLARRLISVPQSIAW